MQHPDRRRAPQHLEDFETDDGPCPARASSCSCIGSSPGVSQLWVTPGLPCGEGDEAEDHGLFSGLRRALASGDNIAVTYDFRGAMPDDDFTRGLAEFCQENLEQWAGRLKSAALLVQDNVLEAAAQGPVAKFLRACPCPPGCPFVLCHSAPMVEEFFQACLGSGKLAPRLGAQFLSVVDVLDDPRKQPQSYWASRSRGRACLASLAPSPTLAEAGAQAQMLHLLPNGDTRVIQSPPQDVVVRSDSRRGSKGEWAVDEDVKLLCHLPEDGLEDLTTLAALAFDCPREELRQIVGAHFHVGELAMDIEREPHTGSWRCRQPSFSDGGASRLETSCAEGVAELLYEAMLALTKGLNLKPSAKCRGRGQGPACFPLFFGRV